MCSVFQIVRMSLRSNKSSKPQGLQYGGPSLSLRGTIEVEVNRDQLSNLRTIFETHPTIIAARSVLESQLLGSGLQMKINGETIEMDSELSKHIEETWIPFARDVISNMLVNGFVVVGFEKEDTECATSRSSASRRIQSVLSGKVRGKRSRSESASKERKNVESQGRMIPVVASTNHYKLSYTLPPGSYLRRYKIVKLTSGLIDDEDTESNLILYDAPDDYGNVNSPIASVYSIIQFVDTLIDSAMTAEVNRSNPMLVTEQQSKEGGGISASDMFFDAESQTISNGQRLEENEYQAKMLHMQLKFCKSMNSNEIPHPPGVMGSMFSGGTSGLSGSMSSAKLFRETWT